MVRSVLQTTSLFTNVFNRNHIYLHFFCRRFEKKHLAQIKTVYPSSLEFRQDRFAGKSSEFELNIEYGRGDRTHNKLTLTATELLARRDVFQKNLLKLTKKHHQVPLLYSSVHYLLRIFRVLLTYLYEPFNFLTPQECC